MKSRGKFLIMLNLRIKRAIKLWLIMNVDGTVDTNAM